MIMLKAATREVMDAQLLKLGLLVEYVQRQDGAEDVHFLMPAKRVSVTGYKDATMPPIWDVKPVYDADGNVTTAGVESSDYHCNVHDIAGIIKDETPYHEDDNPTGTDWGDVTWIDPATVNTPAHTF